MLIVLRQLFILYAFILVGWFLGKRNPTLSSHTGLLSYLLANFLLPAKVFETFANHFSISYLQNNQRMIIISTVLVIALHYLSKIPAKYIANTRYERNVYEYSFTIANFAFMGFALVEGLFGASGLADQILFCIPFTIYTYTIGYVKLSGSGNPFLKLLNPMTAALVLGAAFGLMGIQLPETICQVISTSSACVGPMSMMLTGLTLSAFPLHDMINDKQAYLVVSMRLLIIPLFVFGIFHLCGFVDVLPAAILAVAMPTALNPIIFSEAAGESPFLSARLAFLSHLLSIITLPVWLMLL